MTNKEERKIRRMRKTVLDAITPYGFNQTLQYSIAKMAVDPRFKTLEDMKNQLEKVALETLEDLQDYLDGKTLESEKPAPMSKPAIKRKKLF